MDSKYLQENVGQCLVECVAEVTLRRPPDPIEFMSRWLRHHANYCKHVDREKILAEIAKHSKPGDSGGAAAAAAADGDKDSIDDGGTGSQEIEDILEDIASDNLTTKLRAVRACRKLLSSERSPPIDSVIEAGLLSILLECMQYPYKSLQFEAGWALTNVASGSTAQTQAVVDVGAVPVLIQCLDSQYDDVADQCIWALGNIIGDCPELREYCIEKGVIGPVLNCVEKWHDSKHKFLQNATWVLVNFCRNKNDPISKERVEEILPTITRLTEHENDKVKSDALWAMSYITDGSNDRIQWVLDTGIVDKVAALITCENSEIRTPALRVLGNIVSGTDQQTQVVVDTGVLNKFNTLLECSAKTLKEAFWFLSNITAGTKEQVQAVIDAGLLPSIAKGLSVQDLSVSKEAAWAVSNMTMIGDPDQVEAAVEAGLIAPLCGILDCEDDNVTKVALEGLLNILKTGENKVEQICHTMEECGGLELIEGLCNDDSDGSQEEDEDSEVESLAAEIYKIWVSQHSKEAIVEKVSSEVIQTKIRGFKAATNILKNDDDVIELLDSEFLSHLIPALQDEDPALQEAAVQFLRMMCQQDDSEKYKATVAKSEGVIAHLIRTLSSKKLSLSKETVWALELLLAGSPERQDQLIGEGVLPPMVTMVTEVTDPGLLERLGQFFDELMSSPDLPSHVYSVCLPAFFCALHRKPDKALSYFINAVAKTTTPDSKVSPEYRQQLEEIILPLLLPLVSHYSKTHSQILAQAVTGVYNIVSKSVNRTSLCQRTDLQHAVQDAFKHHRANYSNSVKPMFQLLHIITSETSPSCFPSYLLIQHLCERLDVYFCNRGFLKETFLRRGGSVGQAQMTTAEYLLSVVQHCSQDQLTQFLEYNVLQQLLDTLKKNLSWLPETYSSSESGSKTPLLDVIMNIMLIIIAFLQNTPDPTSVSSMLREADCLALLQENEAKLASCLTVVCTSELELKSNLAIIQSLCSELQSNADNES